MIRDPYVRWCESRGRATSLSYSIYGIPAVRDSIWSGGSPRFAKATQDKPDPPMFRGSGDPRLRQEIADSLIEPIRYVRWEFPLPLG